MKTAIYIRVSTEDQVERYGLPVQLRACREYALRNGMNVVAEISDEGVSGAVIDRPGLDRIRSMARAGEIQAVLMLDVDRLSRELAHLLILKPELERKVQLEFVAAKFEDSPSGRMFFGIRGVIGQYERELTRERTMRGRRERARNGLIVGGRVPYGYRYESGRLVEDADRALIARRIYADYESGLSIRSIVTRLRESGAVTWGGGPWGKSSVARILTNETYAGVAHYGTHRREGKLLRLREPSERIMLAVPALVSREQWARVQARLNANAAVGRPSVNYLLRGLLHCGSCGRKMAGDGGRNRSYRCTGRDRLRLVGDQCNNHARAEVLDKAVWRMLSEAFSNANFLRDALQRRESELRAENPDDAGALCKSITKWRRIEENALSAMLDAELSDQRGHLRIRYKEAVAARRKAEVQLANIQNSPDIPSKEWIDETAAAVSRFIANLDEPVLKQQFVRRLVDRAEWKGSEIRMVCFIVPELSTTS